MKTINITIQSLLLLIFFIFGSKQSIAQNNIINLEELKKTDKNWELVQSNTGRITYKSQKWLMYFVHWRELNNNNKNISIEYATHLLKTLWGMSFKITNNTGECTVNGHKAYFAEATINDMVKTRFVVWNCEETNRQFIADCNINLAAKTPKELFELQYEKITPNIKCHQTKIEKTDSMLTQYINYPDLNISYYLPKNWRSKEFLIKKDTTKKIPGYYLNGLTQKEGSLWNLLTDSEKQIDLLWQDTNEELSESMLAEFIRKLESDSLVEIIDSIKYVSVLQDFKNSEIRNQKNLITVTGTFDMKLKIPAYYKEETTKYLHQIFMWRSEDKVYFLLVSLIANNKVWGQEFDLTPSNEVFNGFISAITSLIDEL